MNENLGNPKDHESIEEIRKRRDLMIQKYLEVKDLADSLNEEAYALSCEVERLNLVMAMKSQTEGGERRAKG